MARIRTIKPEIAQSESLGAVSRDARWTFTALLTQADDEGRLAANLRVLVGLLFPFDDDARELLSGWLDELERVGCIQRYTVDGKPYISITGWRVHQKIDRPTASRLPAPPASEHTRISVEDTAKPREHPSSPREPSINVRDASPKDIGSASNPPRSLDAGSRTVDHGSGTVDQEMDRTTASPPAARKRTVPMSCPDDVAPQVWCDWLQLRRDKRAAVTTTVIETARAEAKKAGMTFDAFLRVWCARGSQGLMADWLKPSERASHGAANETAYQRSQREAIELISPRLARKAPGQQHTTIDLQLGANGVLEIPQ